MAIAAIQWISTADGGRLSGPPTAPVYAATAAFRLGDDAELQPGWPRNADALLSILVQRIATLLAEAFAERLLVPRPALVQPTGEPLPLDTPSSALQ